MFTSRAEFRLSMRSDNADRRLTERGVAWGCVGSRRGQHFAVKAAAITEARDLCQRLDLTSSAAAKAGLPVNQDGARRSAWDLLSYPDIVFDDLVRVWPALSAVAPAIRVAVVNDARYDVYLHRQSRDIASYRRDDSLVLPDDLDIASIPGLSREVRERLAAARPTTIGQASRLESMTPAALALLALHARRRIDSAAE
jgi:tRNA uridine 5-carboxymethylaminomethyl modification enzyme